MRRSPAFDVAVEAALLRRAYEDTEAGRDPLPNKRRSFAAVPREDASMALFIAVNALIAVTGGDLDRIVRALFLDDELAEDADAMATGVAEL